MSQHSARPGLSPARDETDSVRRPGQTVAGLIARYLRWRGVERAYGLCGGHIQPIWDELAQLGVAIIDVRHEAAAVYMAHAEAELTGRPGVALVTAGPGLTNAVTGIANAATSRVPLLLLSGRPPRPQTGRGALQELPQRAVVAPLCRAALTADRVREVLPRLDEALLAVMGWDDPPGPEPASLLGDAGIPYLDSGESRGVLPPGHPSVVSPDSVSGVAVVPPDQALTKWQLAEERREQAPSGAR